MLGTIVDTKELYETVIAALIAGVGLTTAYSVMIFGLARFGEYRRSDRPLAATAFGAVAALALAVTAGGIVLGMIVMLSK